MIIRPLDRLNPPRHRSFPRGAGLACTLLAVLTQPLAAQGPLTRRLDRLLDQPPFNRATWGVVVTDSTGRTLFERNGDRLLVPASNAKVVVAAAALALLGP